jgi:hypothetical protein
MFKAFINRIVHELRLIFKEHDEMAAGNKSKHEDVENRIKQKSSRLQRNK